MDGQAQRQSQVIGIGGRAIRPLLYAPAATPAGVHQEAVVQNRRPPDCHPGTNLIGLCVEYHRACSWPCAFLPW